MSRKFSRMVARESFDEDLDIEDSESEVIESEVAPEVVEASEAETEVGGDAETIEVIGEGIEDSEADAEALENQEEMLEAVLEEDPSNEDVGIDEVALEMLNNTLMMIQRNRGFDLSGQRRMVARESFDARHVSKRDMAVRALESIKDTLQNIWEAIKSALKTLWSEIKKFWDKHFSTLGRLKKAIDSAKKKVNKTKGSPNLSKDIKLSGSFKRAVPGGADVDAKVVKEIISDLEATIKVGNDIITAAKDYADSLHKMATSSTVAGPKVSSREFHLGTESDPLIGGFYGTVKFEEEDTDRDDRKKYKAVFDKETADIDERDERDFIVGTKSELTSVLSDAQSLLTKTQKLGKDNDKTTKDYNAIMKQMDKAVNDASDDDRDDLRANARSAARQFRIATSIAPQVTSKIASLNVSAIKLALNYVSVSLSHYKKLGK